MDILQLLAADREILLYRKELNKITKKVTATILLQQMIYWHTKMGGSFYKFIEPCKNDAYNEGDSWCEELGFSVKEFTTAYKTLEDLGVVSKKINMNRVTFYHLNIEMLRKRLNGIYVNQLSAFTQPPFGNLDITETTTETTSDIINTPLTPREGRRGMRKTLTLTDIAEQNQMTISTIEDYVQYRLNSGGIDNSIAFKHHVQCGLSEPYSNESVQLEEWFKALRHTDIIDHLVGQFLSTQRTDRRFCRELAKDDFILKTSNIIPSDIVIEIAYQKAEVKRRERVGGVV
ncbi:MAG: hypothetical protein PHX59_05775 [Sulfuricurvum sp.]|nr:hypothetical protein [Sulfuricurvum sp.]